MKVELVQNRKVFNETRSYTYDLNDSLFVDYFEQRTGIRITVKEIVSKVEKGFIVWKRIPKNSHEWDIEKRELAPNFIGPQEFFIQNIRGKIQKAFEIYSHNKI